MKASHPDVAWYGEFEYQQKTCPRCGSADVSFEGYSATLLGWFGGPEENPNQHSGRAKCRACDLVYDRHWVPKRRQSWATVTIIHPGDRRETFVVAGTPGTGRNSYFLLCTCGEWAENNQRGKSIRYTVGQEPDPPDFWFCTSCGYSAKEPPKLPDLQPRTAYERLLEDNADLG